MATRGQTHNKRARELALKERRERKQAKKEDRRAGIDPSAADGEMTQADDLEPTGDLEPADDLEPSDDLEQPAADEEPVR
jgi:hypothetical protein